jgi:hypothetical protein
LIWLALANWARIMESVGEERFAKNASATSLLRATANQSDLFTLTTESGRKHAV